MCVFFLQIGVEIANLFFFLHAPRRKSRLSSIHGGFPAEASQKENHWLGVYATRGYYPSVLASISNLLPSSPSFTHQRIVSRDIFSAQKVRSKSPFSILPGIAFGFVQASVPTYSSSNVVRAGRCRQPAVRTGRPTRLDFFSILQSPERLEHPSKYRFGH